MPSTAYSSLLGVVSKYVEPTKAVDIVLRQIQAKKLSPDSLTTADLGALCIAVSTAAGLYVAQPDAREQMKTAIKTLCGK